jgi:ribonuclease P protein component
MKCQRLTKRPQFLACAASGKKAVTNGLILQARAHDSENEHDKKAKGAMRIGFTASGKVGNAVVRNRAKRRLRSLADEIMAAHAMPAHDYVLIARDQTIGRDFDALRKDLEAALKKLKLWSD